MMHLVNISVLVKGLVDREIEETILLNNAQKFYANLVVNSSLMYNNKMKELVDLDFSQ